MRVPKIIHQTWTDENVPERFHSFISSWKKNHPEWKYQLWTFKKNEEFIASHFPEFLTRYQSYVLPIQRVDVSRYLVLSKIGGVFIDIDVECLRNIEPLLCDAKEMFIGKEPSEHCEEYNKSMILSNAFLASTPDNAFLKFVSSEVLTHQLVSENLIDEVLESTGPLMLTRSYEKYHNKSEIKLLEPEIISPLSKNELIKKLNKKAHAMKVRNAYAIHYYEGSWWKSDSVFILLIRKIWARCSTLLTIPVIGRRHL